jgi:hypothetical protein
MQILWCGFSRFSDGYLPGLNNVLFLGRYATNVLANVIEESCCGVNIEPKDLNGLIRAICMFADDKCLLDKYNFAARQTAIKTYSRSVNSKLFANLLKTCFSNVK